MNKQTLKLDVFNETFPEKSLQDVLPAKAAQSYICEMLYELTKIAEGAQLKDLAALLKVTVAAAEISVRNP